MAAQFADVVLPLAHERTQLFEIPDGDYNCRVVQLYDPESIGLIENPSPHFLLERYRKISGTIGTIVIH